MEMRRFGQTDMTVRILGFGAAEIGFEQSNQEAVTRLLHESLDAGLNVIDTAECYLASEELIGQAVATRRNEFYLFTKCGHPEHHTQEDWRPESLLRSIERSLKRLRTDRVDLVQLHTCSEAELRKGDVISALQQARDKGYTRYIGYSGDGAAARYAVVCRAFDALQISISIADQESIDQVMPLAHESGIGVIAKRPIANAVWRYATRPEESYHQPYWDRMKQLDYDFVKATPERAGEIALRFTLMIPGVHTAIVGSTKPGRWRENAKLLEAGALAREQFDAIRARWRAIADASWTGQS